MKTYTVVLQGPQESTQVEGPLEAIELDVFENVEGSARARSLFGGNHLTLREVVDNLGVDEDAKVELERARKALRQIAAIANNPTGSDWDEIEQARRIALAALAALCEPHPLELKQEDVNEALRLLKAGPNEDLVSAAKRVSDAMGDLLTVQAASAHIGQTIRFDYKNHRGAHGRRQVRVELVFFCQTAYHPQKQWFLRGLDVDKNEWRDFAVKDISDGRLTPTE